ncbi:MAG: PfkB family carbohydrate kinase [Acidobacteriota bacterium]
MSLLVVGSLAFDTIETPFGKVEEALGGSATYISTASSYFASPVRVVGVVGGDFPKDAIDFLNSRNIDTEGIEVEESGKTFRWSGRYHYDLNMRDTLYTHLNVFEHFDPKIPASYRTSKYVCLGNIDPVLQRRVLEQIERPKLVVGDTMNFWIERKKEELAKTIEQLDVLIINDSEARLLADDPNLFKAAKKILAMGVKSLIIKKGEHGALLITNGTIFSAPAYPLESIFDPTGAGDTFAGGFIGYLAKMDDTSDEALKKAVIYGSTMASFCVEQFSLEALKDLTYLKIQDRYREFRMLSRFED